MARVDLIWVETPGLEGLDPQAAARAAGLNLARGGVLEAAVVTAPEALCPPEVSRALWGKPAVWLDLGSEVGGGDEAHRLARAAAALSRAAGLASRGTLPQLYAPQPVQRVLVIGGGYAALAAACHAAALGHPVLLASPLKAAHTPGGDDDPDETSLLAAQLPAGVETSFRTRVLWVEGGGGDFRAGLQGPQGKWEDRFGAVVLAPPGAWQSQGQAAGLSSELGRPLEGLEPESVAGPEDGWLQVAVLAGPERPLTSAAFARAMARALVLQNRPRVQVTFLYDQARVATEGGERLWREMRRAGVLVCRVVPGSLKTLERGRVLAWRDPVLDEEMELAPDVALLAEDFGARAPEWLSGLSWPAWEWLAPEGPRLGGGKTSKTGFFITGALRGTPPGPERLAQAAAAAASLHELLAGEAAAPLPAVRHTQCASCLTCVRVCPHGVPSYRGDQVVCAPAACLACGICAAECPAEAITPPGWSNGEMTAALAAGLARSAAPSLVAFLCKNSAQQAMAELSAGGHVWPAGMLAMPVNCAGRVGQQLIMKALGLGAGAVLVAGCREGNCRSINGNLRAGLRARETRELLQQIGEDPRRVSFINLAGNQPTVLARAVAEAASVAGEVKA